jgi:DNA-binding transcriptional MerR regulator
LPDLILSLGALSAQKIFLDNETVNCHYKVMKTEKYTIEELAESTGFTRRTIRYYVQEGLLEPPAGRGRGGFYYDSHVRRLLKIKTLQEKGMRISEIAKFQARETPDTTAYPRNVMVRYEIMPGVELNISREMETKEPRKINEMIRVLKAIAKGDIENEGK